MQLVANAEDFRHHCSFHILLGPMYGLLAFGLNSIYLRCVYWVYQIRTHQSLHSLDVNSGVLGYQHRLFPAIKSSVSANNRYRCLLHLCHLDNLVDSCVAAPVYQGCNAIAITDAWPHFYLEFVDMPQPTECKYLEYKQCGSNYMYNVSS